MKLTRKSRYAAWIWVSVFVSIAFALPTQLANAAELLSAHVTQVIKDVQLLPRQTAARPAAVNDEVDVNTAVRTGADSRTELTFADLTIARLGANTVFSFNREARELDLRNGAVLVGVPRNGASVRISTIAVTAAVSGGTALFEYHPKMAAKLLVMEGKGEFCSKRFPDECVTVHGGEMAMSTADGHLSKPKTFNAALVNKTSKLITSFPPLPNADLIQAVIEQQQEQFAGTSNSNSTVTNDPIDVTSTSVTANPTSTGGSAKFGPPSAITGPNPYVITNGTSINTDPTITSGGITDFGKLYRGASLDGPFPTWLGSSPSAFDSVDFFDSGGGGVLNPDKVPIAAFLFAGLQLSGDPTVSNPSNYPTLALVSQGGITTSAAGTIFTFSGMPGVGLVALNGSINLSGVGFANFGDLFVYARGSGSNLNMDATIQNLEKVELRAEGDVNITGPVTTSNHVKALAGNNLTAASTITSNNIVLQSLGRITVTSSAQLLAMLDSLGNRGQVIIISSGSDTPIAVSGTVTADQGEVDIRQTGVAGPTTLNNAMIHGDVVKISALGANGVLTIGSGNVINADTILKLYAPGSNGTLNFISNVTLTSPTNILAANTINISQGVVVTINSVNQANVYTNNANYFGYGGSGTPVTSGTFGGAGAKNPLPLAQAPPLGAPGHGP